VSYIADKHDNIYDDILAWPVWNRDSDYDNK
jgi:hypothetical protein